MLTNDEGDETENDQLIYTRETTQGINGSSSLNVEQLQIQTSFEN